MSVHAGRALAVLGFRLNALYEYISDFSKNAHTVRLEKGPSLDIDFMSNDYLAQQGDGAGEYTLPELYTSDRSTMGTYRGSDGFLHTLGAYSPRIHHTPDLVGLVDRHDYLSYADQAAALAGPWSIESGGGDLSFNSTSDTWNFIAGSTVKELRYAHSVTTGDERTVVIDWDGPLVDTVQIYSNTTFVGTATVGALQSIFDFTGVTGGTIRFVATAAFSGALRAISIRNQTKSVTGLLIEPERTNILIGSGLVGMTSTTGVVEAETYANIDGMVFKPNSSSGTTKIASVLQDVIGSQAGTECISFCYRFVGGLHHEFQVSITYHGTTFPVTVERNGRITIGSVTGATLTSPVVDRIESWGNGLYRFGIVLTNTVSADSGFDFSVLPSVGGSITVAGNGEDGIWVGGLMVERGRMSSLIQTLEAPVTRSDEMIKGQFTDIVFNANGHNELNVTVSATKQGDNNADVVTLSPNGSTDDTIVVEALSSDFRIQYNGPDDGDELVGSNGNGQRNVPSKISVDFGSDTLMGAAINGTTFESKIVTGLGRVNVENVLLGHQLSDPIVVHSLHLRPRPIGNVRCEEESVAS